ncbi:DUF1289 domain-containing protein [Kaistia dalseonensis]|uniref:DUF1289 domain-containing protein n=1 Tax=Kaistia dalseonensis TaxID=410840 RepID=UPI002250ED1C|nr:DUF1289 domain-containing protein [Kaistia dalseonensis]MCX5493876.1 DUF1289 domain-containing protein [Kaistia dalseonensis]
MISPCIHVCVINPATGLCKGCGRSLEQIANWSIMTDAERHRIMVYFALQHEAGRSGDQGRAHQPPAQVE